MNSFAMFLSSLCSHDLTARLPLDMYRDCNNIHAHILQIKSKQSDYGELAEKLKSIKNGEIFWVNNNKIIIVNINSFILGRLALQSVNHSIK